MKGTWSSGQVDSRGGRGWGGNPPFTKIPPVAAVVRRQPPLQGCQVERVCDKHATLGTHLHQNVVCYHWKFERIWAPCISFLSQGTAARSLRWDPRDFSVPGTAEATGLRVLPLPPPPTSQADGGMGSHSPGYYG